MMKSRVRQRQYNWSEVVTLAIFVIYTNIFTAQPLETKCGTSCEAGQPYNLKYNSTKTYVYNFTTVVTTKIVGTSSESTDFTLTGNAKFVVWNADLCDATLKLNNVQIQSSQGNYQGATLEGSSIRFSSWKGSRDIHICLSPDDLSWSANVKRSLVSLFTSVGAFEGDKLEEDRFKKDISGRICRTKYQKIGADVYSEAWDLNDCTGAPPGGNFAHLGIDNYSDNPYGQNSYKGNGHFDSSRKCTYNYTSGLLQSTQCTESHKLKAFSVGNNGAQTRVQVSIVLNKIQDEVSSPEKFEVLTKRENIAYDTTPDAVRNFEQSEPIDKLRELLAMSVKKQGTASSVFQIHSEIKKTMTLMSEADLNKLMLETDTIRDYRDSVKNVLSNAAIIAGTKETIKFVLKFKSFENPDFLQKSLRLFTLHNVFAEAPDADGIIAITKIVPYKKNAPQFLLAASGLAFKYSEVKNYSVPIYNALVDKIAEYANSDADEKVGIAVLQALGNLKSHTDKAIDVITANLKNSGRLLINALQAFRRNPCEEVLRNKTLDIFSDFSQPSNVRIHAYLALVRCLPLRYSDTPRTITRILKNETSKQVLLFINSHVKNDRHRARHSKGRGGYYNDIFLPDNVPQYNNGLKFSKNFAYFDSKDGVAHFVEGSVIYSTDSYLPKTLEAKVEFDLYGRTYHFAEVGVNLDKFDANIEKFFGPGGKFTVKKKMDSRAKREITEAMEVDKFVEKLYKYEDNPVPISDKSIIDAHFRIFGTTVLVNFYEDVIDNILTSKDSVGSILQNAFSENIGKEWNKLISLPEYELIVPTISGFPLKLSLRASGANSFSQEFTYMSALMTGRTGGNFRGRMSVGSGPIESGVEVDINLNLNLAGAIIGDSIFSKLLSKEQPFSFKIIIPMILPQVAELKTKLSWFETLDKNSMIGLVTEEKPKPESSPICSQMVTKLTGLKLCGQIRTPIYQRFRSPSFPLNGQSIYSLTLDKSTPSIEEFFAEFKTTGLQGDLTNTTGSASIVLDTPGSLNYLKTEFNLKFKSQVDRQNAGIKEMSLEVKLDSWWKNLKFLLKSSENPSNQSYEISIVNDKVEYELRGHKNLRSARKEQIGSGETRSLSVVNAYELLLISPSGISNLLMGSTTNNFEADERENEIEGAEASGAIELEANIPALNLQGEVSTKWERSTKSGDVFVFNLKHLKGKSKDFGTIELNGYANLSKSLRKFSLDLDANNGQKSEHTAKFLGNYDLTDPEKPLVKTQMISTRVPSLNFDGKFAADYSSQEKSITLLMTHKASNLLIAQSTKYKIGHPNIELHNEMELSYPKLGIGWFSTFNSILPNYEGQYITNAMLKTKNAPSKEVSFDIIYGPDRSYEIKTKLQSEETLLATFFSDFKRAGDDKWNFSADTSVRMASHEPFTSKLEATISGEGDKGLVATISSNRLETPIKMESGSVETPDRRAYIRVTQSDLCLFNLFVDNEEDAKFIEPGVDVNHRRHTFNSSLHNVYDTHLEIIEARGRSAKNPLQLNFYFDWLPTERRITYKSIGYTPGEDIIGIHNYFEWDARKDPSKFFSYNITCISTPGPGRCLQLPITIRKELTVVGQTYVVTTTYGSKNIKDNNALGFDIEYISPENKTYGAGVEALFPKFYSPTSEFKINLTTQFPGQEMAQYPLEIKFTKLDSIRETGEFEFGILYEPGQKIIRGQRYPSFRLNLNSNIEDDERTISGSFYEGGFYFVVPVGLSMETSFSPDIYRVTWSAEKANKTSGEVSVDLSQKSGKSGFSLRTALENKDKENRYQSVFNSSLDIIYLIGPANNFEVDIKESLLLFYQNNIFALDQIVQISNGTFQFGGTSTTQNVAPRYEEQIQEDIALGKILTGLPKLTRNGVILSPENNGLADSIQTSLRISISPNFPESGVSSISAKLPFRDFHAVELRVQSDLVTSGDRPFLEFGIAINNQSERTLKLEHLLGKTRDYNGIRATVQWGTQNEQLVGEGHFKDTTKGRYLELIFSGPAVKDVWTANISAIAEKYAFTAKSPTAVDEISMNMQHGSKSVTGDWRVVWKGIPDLIPLKGEFEIVAPFLNNGATSDFKFSASSEVLEGDKRRPVKLNILIIPFDLNKRAALSYCWGFDCQTGDLQFNITSNQSKIMATYDFDIEDVGKTVFGVLLNWPLLVIPMSTSEVLLKAFKEFQPTANSEKFTRNFGLRCWKTSSETSVGGIEIILPERIIATEIAVRNGSSSGGTDVGLKLWLNKEKEPRNNLTIILTSSALDRLGAPNRFNLVAQHPDFEKDLKVTVNFAEHSNGSIKIKTELDIFKTTEDQVIFMVDWKSKPSLVYSVSAKSTGRGLSLTQDCDYSDGGSSRHCSLTFRDTKSKIDKSLNIRASREWRNTPIHYFQIDNTGEILFGVTTKTLLRRGQSPEYISREAIEIQLAGTTQKSRAFFIGQRNRGAAGAGGVFIQTTKANYPTAGLESEFTELLIDSPRKAVALPLTLNDASGSHLLTNLVMGENNTCLVFAKFLWDNERIQKYLVEAKTGFQETRDGMNKVLLSTSNDLSNVHNSIASSFEKSNVDLSSLFKRIKGQMSQIREELFGTELRADPVTPIMDEGPAICTGISNISLTSKNTIAIIDGSFEILNVFLERIGAISNYLANIKSGSASSSSSGIAKRVQDAYRKLESYSVRLSENVRYKQLLTKLDGFGFNSVNFVGYLEARWRQGVFEKYEEFYQSLTNDLLLLFPYNETKEFQESYRAYVNSILFEDTGESILLVDVVDKFSKALEKGISELYNADYQSGVISTQIPVIPQTETWRNFLYDKPSEEVGFGFPDFPLIRKAFPPVDAYGVLIGPHFISFDGRVGTINSACKYLLASDIIGKKFNIVANVKYDTSDSTYFTTNLLLKLQKMPFNLGRDSKIGTINGAQVEPESDVSNEIEPDDDAENMIRWVVIKGTDDGVEILCSISKFRDLCIVKVSGFYHGKVRGLLGVYNNEPQDDLTVPSGDIVESNQTFSNSWKLDPTCKEINTQSDDDSPTKECDAIANKNSPFRPCFNTIDPGSYIDLCRALIKKNYGTDKAVCTVTLAYAKVCEDSNVLVAGLKKCSLKSDIYSYHYD